MSLAHKLKALAVATVALALGTAFAQAEPLKITIGWSQTPGHMAPLLFQNKSILKHYGKTYIADPVRFRGSTAQITALASGQLDIAALSATAFVLAVTNAGVDARVVGDVIQDRAPYWSTGFRVLKSSGINKIEDLKGKRIATNAIGSAIDTSMRGMLHKHGLSNDDFNTIEVAFGNMPAMLMEGKVDMAPILPQFVGLLDKDKVKTMFTSRDVTGEQQTVSLVARKDFIEKNRAALVDFFEDYVRALHWFLDPANRKEALKIVMDFTKRPLNRIDYAFTKDDFYRDPNDLPNIPNLQHAIDLGVKNGVLKKSIEAEKYSDLSLIHDAMKRLTN
jgi:ABC-type nitrate/sulfonate/bicarbonate transport system substrate-binding protein